MAHDIVFRIAFLALGRGTNVAELVDGFDPESDNRFAAEFVVRSVAVTLTFV